MFYDYLGADAFGLGIKYMFWQTKYAIFLFTEWRLQYYLTSLLMYFLLA